MGELLGQGNDHGGRGGAGPRGGRGGARALRGTPAGRGRGRGGGEGGAARGAEGGAGLDSPRLSAPAGAGGGMAGVVAGINVTALKERYQRELQSAAPGCAGERPSQAEAGPSDSPAARCAGDAAPARPLLGARREGGAAQPAGRGGLEGSRAAERPPAVARERERNAPAGQPGGTGAVGAAAARERRAGAAAAAEQPPAGPRLADIVRGHSAAAWEGSEPAAVDDVSEFPVLPCAPAPPDAPGASGAAAADGAAARVGEGRDGEEADMTRALGAASVGRGAAQRAGAPARAHAAGPAAAGLEAVRFGPAPAARSVPFCFAAARPPPLPPVLTGHVSSIPPY